MATQYTYKGTKITGTSTTAKVFKNSGVKDAKKGQTYLNKEEGHVYKCTEGGAPNTAKWIYKKTVIVKKPSLGVKSLGNPVRQSGNRKMKVEWKIPGDLVNAQKGDRATGIDVRWIIEIPKRKDPVSVADTKNENATSSEINLDNFKVGNTTYRRNSFYPLTKKYLNGVSVLVAPDNGKGRTAKPATAERKFKKPREPVIANFSFNTNNGVVSTTITTNAGADYQERYDTQYVTTIRDTRTGQTWQHKAGTGHSTATSIPISYNVSDYQQLIHGQYVEIKVEALSRGYAGDSKKVTKTGYVGYPAKATLSKPTITSKDSAGRCIIPVSTNSSAAYPVDQIRLEYLANVPYATAAAIPGGAEWTSTDIVDDANCTALAIGVSDLVPDAGNHTWIRAKTHHFHEGVLYRYSNYVEVTDLYTPAPTAAEDKITIISAAAGADGESAVVILGWNADGQDNSTGTELSWSDASDAWKSTDDPDTYDFTWSDGQRTARGVTYRDSATITIKGLKEGTKYYIRARRYLEGETLTYSKYSNIATVVTSETPDAVIASADRYVSVGESLQVSWTFSGNGIQKKWQIVKADGKTVIASGEGGMTSTQIAASRLRSFANNNSLTFTVQVSTGSGFVISEQHTVTIQDPPTLALTVPATLTAQPATFTAEASSECDLIVIVTAQGAVGQFPEGMRRQPAGDTVYSGVIVPEWTGDGPYTTTVTLPTGLDFWDLAQYNVAVTAVDRSTGLQSTEQTAVFGITWAHQAPSIEPTFTYTATADTSVDDAKNYFAYDAETQTYTVTEPEGDEDPAALGWFEQTETEYVTITAIDTTDDEGIHHQAVQIALTPPPGAAETDFYDIYRMTGDGAYLIGESFPLTYTATDEYAPFGAALTLHYRIATRTADGDVAFSDIEYVADGDRMRFDWAGGSLELPYNISIGDSYKKDFQLRKHMGGSVDGYWNSNIERTASLSSDLIRLDQQEDVIMARQLAHYSGPVFVRTPDGSAYEANVQVSDMSTTGVLEAIAIDATEIGLTQEFILPTPYPLVEEE